MPPLRDTGSLVLAPIPTPPRYVAYPLSVNAMYAQDIVFSMETRIYL